MSLFWVALIVAIVASLLGLMLAIDRGVRLYRLSKRVGGRMSAELEKIERTTAELETHMRRFEDATDRLQVATARLEASRARLNVLLQAIKEARAALWWVPVFGSR